MDQGAKLYHKNPRKITTKRFEQLRKSLEKLGDLSGIVHDLNSDEIISGNQRSTIFNINECDIEIITKLDKPDDQGTVAIGFVIWKDKKYSYRQVRWTSDLCDEANILANLAGGDWDMEALADWDIELLKGLGFDSEIQKQWEENFERLSDLLDEGGEGDETYTRKIEAPIYTPKGERPAISDLFDDKRTLELIQEIEGADIPDELRDFLIIAARRHTVLNFKRIAEFYAHADENVQALMENSALVIIDFDRAIELGYVKLSKQLVDQYIEDHGENKNA